jgi:hypothetical protein
MVSRVGCSLFLVLVIENSPLQKFSWMAAADWRPPLLVKSYQV